MLKDGEKLRYACREFIKGNGNDEERLLRRVMIARRNNIRDHELLKKARLRAKTEGIHQQLAGVPAGVVSTPQQQQQLPPLSSPPPLPTDPTQQAGVGVAEARVGSLKRKEPDQDTPTTDSTTLLTTVAADGSTVTVPQQNPTATTIMADGSTKKDVPITQTPTTPVTGSLVRKRAKSSSMSDLEVKLDMDEPAVEATRSYKTWLALPDGAEFTYNQSYTKGKQGHDWLLKKNIWRRMRYRRENKKMVERMKKDQSSMPLLNQDASTASAAAVAAAATAHLATAPPIADVGHHHTNGMGVLEVENGGDNPDATAAAVAAASSGCSAGEDLVNTAIVEAAVAAAASYVKNRPQAAPMKLDHQEEDVVVDPTQAQQQQQETVTNYTIGEEAKDPTTTVAVEVVFVEEKSEHDPTIVIANIADQTTTTQDPLIQEITPEQAQQQMQMQEQIQEIPQEGQLQQQQQQEMQQMIVEHVQDQDQEQIPQEHTGQEAMEAQPEESNNNNNIVDTDAVVTKTEDQQADEENTTSYTVAI